MLILVQHPCTHTIRLCLPGWKTTRVKLSLLCLPNKCTAIKVWLQNTTWVHFQNKKKEKNTQIDTKVTVIRKMKCGTQWGDEFLFIFNSVDAARYITPVHRLC